jgi:RND family efflux transporter MFP subunit
MLGPCACGSAIPQTAAAKATPNTTPVQTARAQTGPVDGELLLSGDVEAVADLSLSPEMAGRVAQLNVVVGSPVRAGQTLAVLDTRSARLRVSQAAAAVQLAQANVDVAARELKRNQGLGPSVAAQVVDKARDGLVLSEAQLAQAKASLDVTQDALRSSMLFSPVDGVVAAVNTEAGEMWSPSSPVPMLRVVDQRQVDIKVWVPSSRLAGLGPGTEAQVEVDAWPGRGLAARVFRVDPVADPRSRSVAVMVRAPNAEGFLRAGMSARVRLALSGRDDTVRVPRLALLEDGAGAAVYVVEKGLAVRRVVRPGLVNRTWAAVLEGVSQGDEVVVVGAQGLLPGAPVEPSPWGAPRGEP